MQGEPLFTKDLNSTVDPSKDFVLNPKTWAQPAPGQFGLSTAYYNDYRCRRRPSENMSLGRLFQFKEGMSLQLRIEWNNVFNRVHRSNPTATNALQTQIRNAAGTPTSGFGYINTRAVASAARNGQLVARFSFWESHLSCLPWDACLLPRASVKPRISGKAEEIASWSVGR